MNIKEFDVIIAGAGPAGCSTALSLANTELKIALIDKAVFPREKICGDGITIDSQRQIKKLSPQLHNTIQSFQKKKIIHGCVVTSTKGYTTFFKLPEDKSPYIIERALFDNELLKECKTHKNINVFEDTLITDCFITDDEVKITTSKGVFKGKMIVGADGVNSLIAKFVNPNKVKETMYGSSVKAYYSNVKDMGYEDAIEIHYINEIFRGYFWIFPMHNNTFNVGFGMDEKMVKKHGVKLGELFTEIINNNPKFKDRFKDAILEGGIKAYRIPVYNRYKKIYGNRVLLVGDSANIVDPLSGEGIGNALRTGRFAADQVKKCFTANNFSKEYNKAYYKRVKKTMFPELNKKLLFAALSTNTFLSNYSLKKNTWLNKILQLVVSRL